MCVCVCILNAVLGQARLDLRQAKDPWKAAAGPEHVILLTMVDLGWEMDNANVMVTQEGARYDLTRTSPKLLSRLAAEAARISRGRGELRQRRQRSRSCTEAVKFVPPTDGTGRFESSLQGTSSTTGVRRTKERTPMAARRGSSLDLLECSPQEQR